MADTNPFANMNTGTTVAPQQQGYTPANGIAAMVKAIMDGNDAYRNKVAQARGHTQVQTPPGAPTSLAPPQDPVNPSGTGTSNPVGFAPPTPIPAQPTAGSPVGGVTMNDPGPIAPTPTQAAAPTPQTMTDPGTMPSGLATPSQPFSANTMDPVTQALMSPIPGSGPNLGPGSGFGMDYNAPINGGFYGG